MFGTLGLTNRPVGGELNRRVLAAIASLTLLVVPVVAVQASAGAATGGVTVTNYTDPTIDTPGAITTGPDGSLWFTNPGNGSIGRIATSGIVSNFTDSTIDGPTGITTGPDGALWFTDSGNSSIGRITTSGIVSNFTDPTIDFPFGITAGPDGALWFTNVLGESIERITTNGIVSKFTDPTLARPTSITVGADGALWFTNSGLTASGTERPSIGRITTDGSITTYPTTDFPLDITAGPDGALWFTMSGAIGRIGTDGTITYYDTGVFNLQGIAAGPDGGLWFTSFDGAIGRISTNGVFTYYKDTSMRGPLGITSGPDGALWFTNQSSNSIGRITTPPPTVVPFGGAVTEGAAGTTSQLPITVTLSAPSTQTVTAQWKTVFINFASNVQAVPGTDYVASTGTVTFPPGATSETVPITVINHDLGMPYKLLVVSFHDPTNSVMGGYGGGAFGFLINNIG
jgi:virginiamycin B lyase